MAYIIDRRLNSKNKSAINRQRFLERYRKHIKNSISDAVSKRSISDIESAETISIPKKDLNEPIFKHGSDGISERVYPGNKEFVKGDRIAKPQSGGGGSGKGGSQTGEGEDSFIFQISQEEFLNYLFDDLELPNLVKRQLSGMESFKYVRSGFVTKGTPSNINIIRSMRGAYARRIALTSGLKKSLKEKEEKLRFLDDNKNDAAKALIEEIQHLKQRIKKIPFLDSIDLKYNHKVKQPKPTSNAVMFCLMDVSGSMNQSMKDIAKRFFILLYLFLKRNYKKIDIVFIRHHTSAKEVNEEEFFYSRETGGTIVSSALKLMIEIIEKRYSDKSWNIYCAEASDGDNWNDDSPLCRQLLEEKIIPNVQYFSYVEINPRAHQALWNEYENIAKSHPDYFAMQQIDSLADIYGVFIKLFKRKTKQ